MIPRAMRKKKECGRNRQARVTVPGTCSLLVDVRLFPTQLLFARGIGPHITTKYSGLG